MEAELLRVKNCCEATLYLLNNRILREELLDSQVTNTKLLNSSKAFGYDGDLCTLKDKLNPDSTLMRIIYRYDGCLYYGTNREDHIVDVVSNLKNNGITHKKYKMWKVCPA